MSNENITSSNNALNLVTDSEVVNEEIQNDSTQTNGNGNGNGKNGKKTTRTKKTRTTSGKSSKTSVDKNTWVKANLTLDPGNKQLKFSLDGSHPIPISSIYKEIKGELPVGKAGCFGYKDKNYIVGNAAHSLKGKLFKAYEGNKTPKLDIWILGALTAEPDFLDGILKDKEHKNKYPGKPCRIQINLKLLSLTTEKVNEIVKTLKGIEKFTYRNQEFEIEIGNLDKDFLYSEGFGAALCAHHTHPELQEFGVVDLGGGTITFTLYRNGRHEPKVFEQFPASGGGMVSIATCIFESMNTGDIGGQHRKLDSIYTALKTGKDLDYVGYRLGNRTHNIAQAVNDGMDLWANDNPTVVEILTRIGQFLLGGGHVFATGGGFGSPVIANWIKEYLTNEIENAQFEVLDNPHIINLTGMQLLDDQQ